MEPFDLPDELRDVERRLIERRRPQPASNFRPRLLSALQAERMPRRMLGRFAVVLAASVLLCLNLAMSLANHRTGPHAEQIQGEDIDFSVRAMRQRHPELSEQEAYQFVVLARSAPALPSSVDTIITHEGEKLWDIR